MIPPTTTNSPTTMKSPATVYSYTVTGSPNFTSATGSLAAAASKSLSVTEDNYRPTMKISPKPSPGPAPPLLAEAPKRLTVFKKNDRTVLRISPKAPGKLAVFKTAGRIMLRIRRNDTPYPLTHRTIIIGPNGRHVTRIFKAGPTRPQRPLSTFRRDGRTFVKISEAVLNNLAAAREEENIQAIIKREGSSGDGVADDSKSESFASSLADIKPEKCI